MVRRHKGEFVMQLRHLAVIALQETGDVDGIDSDMADTDEDAASELLAFLRTVTRNETTSSPATAARTPEETTCG